MKSFTMKALAVAVLGMAGMSVASAATCPTDPAQSGGGAWSSKSVTASTLSIVSPGLAGTNCALSVSINAGAASNGKGLVQDTSPLNEARYRARFYVATGALTNLTAANRQAKIFNVLATSGPAGVTTEEVAVFLLGGAGGKALRFVVGDTGSTGNSQTLDVPFSGATTSIAGEYRVEIDLEQGTAGSCNALPISGGCFRYWVTDPAGSSADASPTGAVAVNNSGWSGAKLVNLGLFSTTSNFRSGVSGQAIVLDEFDSRRQTFIGQ